MDQETNEQPPSYESINPRGTSIPHVYHPLQAPQPVYLSIVDPPDGRDSAAYEDAAAAAQNRVSSMYASINEKDVYSVTDGRYQNQKPPVILRNRQEFSPVRTGTEPRRKVCVVIVIACAMAFIIGAGLATGIVFLTRNDSSDSGEAASGTKSATTTTTTTTTDPPVCTSRATCDINSNDLGLAVPDYDTGGGYSTYNCHVCPLKCCATEVHMIAMYEPEGSERGFQQDPQVIPDVVVNVVAVTEHPPLTFVLSTYEAANWLIKVPNGVTVAHVFLMSYYLRFSSVQVMNADGEELNNYRLHLPTEQYTRLDYKGTGGSSTSAKGIEIVQTMTSQYGCLTSFSGRYVAKSWNLILDKLSTCSEADVTRTSSTTTTTSAPAIEHTDCSTDPCENGGRCTEAGAGPFYCSCTWPYYGQRCEYTNKADTCDINNDLVGMATPDYDRYASYETYNCAVCPTDNCASEVHMIAMYEPEGSVRGFREDPQVIPDVEINIISSSSHLPLSLVLSTYEAISWVVKVPDGISVAHIFLMSYYQSFSSVKVLSMDGTVLSNYRLHLPATSRFYMDHRGTGPPSTYSFGYGCSSCKGVDDVTSTMTSQYGCFTSFSGRYVAKSWTLNLDANTCQAS